MIWNREFYSAKSKEDEVKITISVKICHSGGSLGQNCASVRPCFSESFCVALLRQSPMRCRSFVELR